ncbi:hypothetical protein JCM3770_004366, partial [Rhodotorula araucariae]
DHSSDPSSPPRSRPPPRDRPPSPAQPQAKNTLVLLGGVAVAILLVLLGAFAIYRYFDDASDVPRGGASDVEGLAAKVVTVTKTLSGGVVTTTVLTEAPIPTNGGKTDSSKGGNTKLMVGGSGNIGIGFLPDYQNQNMAKINNGLGIKSSYYGWYAQLPGSGEWDGSQLLSQLDDVKACNCIFQPAVMPTKGWAGLTKDNNFQALAIAKVMKKFTDEGIEVWLRFAHEINWYLTDGTYQGTVEDFKAAWDAVAAAVADNPLVKMFFTPNIAGSFSDYEKFFPNDPKTARHVPFTAHYYYPHSSSERFLDHVEEMYNKWCTDGSIKFAMGETGTMWDASIEERLAWLDQLTSEEAAKAMPNYVGITWFNYNKEQVFYLYDESKEDTNKATKAWFADKGTTAEGAPMGNA